MNKLVQKVFVISLFVSSLTSMGSINRDLTGVVSIDGSSTVYPITEAMAEEFRSIYPKIRVNIGVSGTGGGFKKFTAGETHINNASRNIKEGEKQKAEKNKIGYMEMPVAYDGITLVVNKQNTWVDTITTAELKKIWNKDSKVKTWKDIRSNWPDRPIKLYGPGTDSGTFDYFTKVINGKEGRCRSQYTKSEDDNILIKGVKGDRDALGFFGYAYFQENREHIKALAVDHGKGPVAPTVTSINNGKYTPLSRPIFIYVSADAAKIPAVEKFVNFYMEKASLLAKEVGYISLPQKTYEEYKAKFKRFSHP